MVNTRGYLLLVCLAITSVVIGATGGAAGTPNQETVRGVAMPMTDAQETEALKAMQAIVETLPGVDARSHAVMVASKDGTWWMVYTDREPTAGAAVVEGTVIAPDELGATDTGVIFADRISVSQQGQTVSMPALRSEPDRFAGDVVTVETTYKQLSFAVEQDSKNRVKYSTWGVLQPAPLGLIDRPGMAGRWTTLNLSSAEYGASKHTELAVRLWGSNLTNANQGQRYWIDANTRVTVGVVPTGDGHRFYLIDTDIPARQLPSPDAIAANGAALNDSVVKTTGQLLGVRISTQETLLAAARCAPMSVSNPLTGCMPIPTDATIHAGVLFDGVPDQPRDVVFYYALSNHHQQQAVTLESGTYQVTGRVVSSSELSPALPDGYALEAYDLHRTGALTASAAARDAAASYRADARDAAQHQVKEGKTQATTPDQQQAPSNTTRQPTSRTTARATPTPATTMTAAVQVIKRQETGATGSLVRVPDALGPFSLLAGLAGGLFLLSAIGLESYRAYTRASGMRPSYTIHQAVLCVGLACLAFGLALAPLAATWLNGVLLSLGAATLLVTTIHYLSLTSTNTARITPPVLLSHPYTIVGVATILLAVPSLLTDSLAGLGEGFLVLGGVCWLAFILSIPLRILKTHLHGADAVNTTEALVVALFLAGGSSFSLGSLYTGGTQESAVILLGVWGLLGFAHLLEALWRHI